MKRSRAGWVRMSMLVLLGLPTMGDAGPVPYRVDYFVDDCTPENSIGRGGKGDFWVANGFTAQTGGEIIVSIEASFSNTRSWPLGVHLYDDPNDDWIPDDLVLLQSVQTTFPGFGACHKFPIPPTEVSGVFFVALSYADTIGSMAYNYDFPFLLDHTRDRRKTWYLETSLPGSLNPANLPGAPLRQSDVPGYQGQYFIRATGAPKPIPVASIRYNQEGKECGLEWGATPGACYEILMASDLGLGDWAIVPPGRISASDPHCQFALPVFGDSAYYRLRRSGPAAVLEEDFEQETPGWEVGRADPGHPTQWEVGTVQGGPYSAHGGTRAYGTALAGNYANNAHTTLRSPMIDLTDEESARLKFWYIGDFGDSTGKDYGRVEILDSSETVLLQSKISGLSTWFWKERTLDFPSAAYGNQVYLRFTLHDYNDGYVSRGVYIDDVRVTAN